MYLTKRNRVKDGIPYKEYSIEDKVKDALGVFKTTHLLRLSRSANPKDLTDTLKIELKYKISKLQNKIIQSEKDILFYKQSLEVLKNTLNSLTKGEVL